MKINARNSEIKIDLFILYHYVYYLATSQLYQNYIDDIIIRICRDMSNGFECEKKKGR